LPARRLAQEDLRQARGIIDNHRGHPLTYFSRPP
jgi:hypothetical protein